MIARSPSTSVIPPLSNGDRLTAKEFCRRWDAMPELKHAELIGGQVYVNPPISAGSHGIPQGNILVWLWHYAVATEGVQQISESSVHFGPQDLPQPDVQLRVKDQFGGASRLVRGELHGAPELIVEVAASSAKHNLQIKKPRYAKHGVQEYLVWIVREKRFVWFALEAGEYVELPASRSGILKSRVFPGLWLDSKGLLADNWPKILGTLRKGMETPEYLEFAANLKSQHRKKRKS